MKLRPTGLSVRTLIAAIALSSFVACSKPKVDGRSEEAMKTSLARVRESVPEAKRAEFDAAVLSVTMKDVSLVDLGAGRNPSAMMTAALSGKTADDIFKAGAEIAAAAERRARESALKEISELEKERALAELSARELAKIEVLRARFSSEPDSIGIKQPRILLRVKNGTDKAISRAFFVGKISSPGRAVPWLTEDFNYQIPGGLNPGEEATWNLSPNAFSKWGTVDPPADAGLEVTTVKVNGPKGEELFSVEKFSETDRARLDALKKQYGTAPANQ